MPDASGCPGSEQLAALIEGSVTAAERERLLSHLDSCEDCFEVFGEAARFVQESSAPRVLHWPRKRLVIGLAAALVLLVSIPLFIDWSPTSPPRVGSLSELLDPLVDQVAVTDLARQIDVGRFDVRGFTGLGERARAVRLGVVLVDLQVCQAAGDPVRAQALLRTGASLLRDAEGGAEAAERWRRSDPLPSAEELEPPTAELVERLYLDLGKWSESGRLAASAGGSRLLSRPQFRDFANRAADVVEPGPARQLRRIDRALSEGAPLADLAREFEALLEVY